MRLFKSILVGMTAFLVAGSAAATVTVNNSTAGATTLTAGQTIAIAVRVVWDGQGALQGIFTSTNYDSTLLEFVSATTAPASIFSFTDPDPDIGTIPGMNRLLAPQIINGALRTVQYASGAADAFVDPRAANTAPGRLITTLTFRALPTLAGGVTNISGIVAAGDAIAGDSFVSGTSVSVTVNPIPEPGTALLMGLGLAGLGFAGRRR